MTALVKLQWRTGRLALLGWPLSWSAIIIATAFGTLETYKNPHERAIYAATMGMSRASEVFNGRAYDVNTPGGIMAFEVGFFGQLLIAIGACLLSISRSRRDEEAGRLDIVTAGATHRLSPFAAISCAILASWLIFSSLALTGLIAADLDLTQSARYVFIMMAYGMFWSAIGLLAGQLTQSARTASRMALWCVIASYLIRAIIDGQHWDTAWATPMGWLAEARPWGEWHWWPAIAYLTTSTCLWALTSIIVTRRDLGSGLIPAKEGSAQASRLLRSPAAFSWKLTRAHGMGWLLASLCYGSVLGSLGQEMRDIVAANPGMKVLIGDDSPDDFVTVFALLLTALFAAANGLQVIGRYRTEEMSGRLGLVLSTTVSRRQVWLAWLCTAIAQTLITLVGGVLSTTISLLWATGDNQVTDTLWAGLAYAVPTLTIVALATLLVAFFPEAFPLAWVVFCWASIVGLLAEALQLPEWSRDLSPMHRIGRVPIDDPNLTAVVVLGIATAIALGVGLWTRRDLRSG